MLEPRKLQKGIAVRDDSVENSKMNKFYVALLLATGPLHAQVLVNDFSGAQSIYIGTPYSSFNGSSSPSATGHAGLVNTGYFTVNSSNSGYLGAYSSFGGGNSGWSLPLGYSNAAGEFNLLNVTGFLVSLRRESANTAPLIYLQVVTNEDQQYDAPINLGSVSVGSFMEVSVPLSSLNLSYSSGLTAWMIGIGGDSTNANPQTYNFSVDSIRAVPEPSAISLLLVGLGGLMALRRVRSKAV